MSPKKISGDSQVGSFHDFIIWRHFLVWACFLGDEPY